MYRSIVLPFFKRLDDERAFNQSYGLADCLKAGFSIFSLKSPSLDALYACAPVVERLNAVKNWRYVVTAKEAGSQHLFAQFDQRNEAGKVRWLDEQDEQGRQWEIGYTNSLELNASSTHLKVNLVFARSTDARGKEIVYSYPTNIELTKRNVGRILSIGRSRWKIENETFNTLKNRGYHFKHNYGHGK